MSDEIAEDTWVEADPHDEPITDMDMTFSGIPATKKHQDRVVIVGFADGTRAEAPFDDDTVELWGLNRLHQPLPNKQWTRWFELHDLETFYRDDDDHKRFLRTFHGPVYVREQDFALAQRWGINNAVPFPHRLIVQRFGDYFTNSISWLIAFAIMLEFNDMALYGVDMAQDAVTQAEYSGQRPSCEYFVGIAIGAGIEVFIPPGSDLLKTAYMYGYESGGALRGKLENRLGELSKRKEDFRGKMNAHQGQANELQSQINQIDGAMQDAIYLIKNWTPPNYERFDEPVVEAEQVEEEE